MQVVRFGNELLLIALSGEPVVDWAHKLKQGAGSREREIGLEHSHSSPGTRQPLLPGAGSAPRSPLVWVAGYCNDMCGYIPTRRLQAEGGYEGGRATLWSPIPAPFTNDVEDRVTNAIRRLVKGLCDK
jgi:hypothetical protein